MSSPRYGSLSARTECNHCGAPLPLNVPALETSCAQCMGKVIVPDATWGAMLTDLDEQLEELGEGQGRTVNALISGQKLVYNIKREMPRCEKCHAPLEIARWPVGASRNFACTECGDPASTEPAPAWLVKTAPNARQLYLVQPDPRLSASSLVPLSPADAPRPVALTCPSCGAGLRISVDHPRITPCSYCGTDVYLPDEVWRRLHPVKVVTPFYVRFEGQTQKERERALQAENARWAQAEAAKEARLAEVRDQEHEQEVLAAGRTAWRVALLFAASAAALVGWVWMPWLAPGGGDLGVTGALRVPGIVLLGIVAGITMLAAVYYGSRVIQLRCEQGFDYMLFVTWFWLPFSLAFPFLGALFALARTLILFRGKFGAATITSGSSTSSYDAMDIGKAGHPAAFVFLVIAVAQPLLCLAIGIGF